jgi:AraC family transcriptional regulator
MDEASCESGATPTSARGQRPAARILVRGSDWSVTEFICGAGPDDRPYEERHDAVSMSAVIAGSFNYRSDVGQALMHPGSILLGNHGSCYQCRHDHGLGDRCVSVQIAPAYFAEIAATAAGSSRYRFPTPMLPASREILPQTAILEAASKAQDILYKEDILARLVATAVRVLSGNTTKATKVSAHDERRISRALSHIEAHSDEALDLDRLAAVAAMSKFHFLRVFRRTAGMTPYQYLLGLRLRRAAMRLLTSPEPISKVAYDCGFGDLSTFVNTFRDRFGMSPKAFRRNG